jgi:DNA-binding NtrC family response regulator
MLHTQPSGLLLLVSRDVDFVALYADALAQTGYGVLTVDGGALPQALRDGPKPAAVVVDVCRPLDWAAVAALAPTGIPVVLVTGYVTGDGQFRARAAALRAAAFVLKPVLAEVLVDVVQRVLNGERGLEALVGTASPPRVTK